MPQRIDWERMYGDLGKARSKIKEEVDNAVPKEMDVKLRVGRKPPILYAHFYCLGKLNVKRLKDDLSVTAEEAHERICKQISEGVTKVGRIMKKYELRARHIDSYFMANRHDDLPPDVTHAYEYDHRHYRIPSKKDESSIVCK